MKYFYDADLDLVYLTVCNVNNCIECFYLASPSSATIDLTATERIRTKLLHSHGHECRDVDKVQLMFAIVDPNTTIVYYKLSLGLISLDSLRDEQLKIPPKIGDSVQAASSGSNS